MIFKGKKIGFKIFDVIVVFVFVFLAISAFLLLFRRQSSVDIVVKVNEASLAYQIDGVPNWYAQLFHTGMKETDVFGGSTAEVKAVRTYYSSSQQNIVYLTVKLKTVYSPSNRQFTYKGKGVAIGQTIQISLDDLLVNGLIIDVGGVKKAGLKRILAEAQIKNLDPVFPQTEGVPAYVADNIKEGEVMNDSLGAPAIKILKKTVDDAKMTVVTADGEVLLQKNPLRKDVFLDLEIWAKKIGDRYYLFGDTNFPILVESEQNNQTNNVTNVRSDHRLPFATSTGLDWLTITKINDIQ